MITIFNRRELITTMDMRVQTNVRTLLAADGIDYEMKTISLIGRNGNGYSSNVGMPGMSQASGYEYKIYVHKKDYERATCYYERTTEHFRDIKAS